MTVPSTCCAERDECSRSSNVFLLTADTRGKKWQRRFGARRLEVANRQAIKLDGFEVLPKRWIVERTFAWISRNRRLARDFERYAATVAAFVRLAMIRIMLRRLAANASS